MLRGLLGLCAVPLVGRSNRQELIWGLSRLKLVLEGVKLPVARVVRQVTCCRQSSAFAGAKPTAMRRTRA